MLQPVFYLSLNMFYRAAPRLLLYNFFALLIGIGIVLDLDISDRNTDIRNTTYNDRHPTVMREQPMYGFITYFGLIVGCTSSIFYIILIYIFANYVRVTFDYCCLSEAARESANSIDWVQQVSFTSNFCSYLTTTLQIVTLWPHVVVSCGLVTGTFSVDIAQANSFDDLGTLAFALSMLAAYYILPVLLALSILETKALVFSVFPRIFSVAYAHDQGNVQNAHLFLQALVVNVGSLIHIIDLNLNQAAVFGLMPWTLMINVANFPYWMATAVSVLLNAVNLFHMLVNLQQQAYDADVNTFEERIEMTEVIGRAEIKKGKTALIAVHKKSAYINQAVKIEEDLLKCESTSDLMALVNVTLLGQNKQITVEEFQLSPDVSSQELADRKEISNLRLAEVKSHNNNLKLALERQTLALVLLMQLLMAIVMATLVVFFINESFSAQAAFVLITNTIFGRGAYVNLLNVAATIFQNNDFAFYDGQEGYVNSTTEELLFGVQRALCPQWAQCLVKESYSTTNQAVCGSFTITPENIEGSEGYYAVPRPSFIFTPNVGWTIMYWACSFAAGGGLAGLLYAQCGLRVQGLKAALISLLCVIISAFVGAGCSCAFYTFEVFDPSITLVSEQATSDGSEMPSIPIDTNFRYSSFCTGTFGGTSLRKGRDFGPLMLAVALKFLLRKSRGVEHFQIVPYFINALVIMTEMLYAKRRVVRSAQGAEVWATLMGTVFGYNTLFLTAPISIILSYLVSQFEIGVSIQGVSPYIFTLLGVTSDILKNGEETEDTDSAVAGALTDYRPESLSMLEMTYEDRFRNSLYPSMMGIIFIVHLTCCIIIRNVNEESSTNVYTLRALVLFGYVMPGLYTVRVIYIGFLVPSIINNLSGMVGLIYLLMGLPFLLACCASEIIPVFLLAPSNGLVKSLYYLAFLLPAVCAISLILAWTGSGVYDEAQRFLLQYQESYPFGSYVECTSGGSNCAPGWPQVLGLMATGLFLLWLCFLSIIYARKLPQALRNMHVYIVDESTKLSFIEMFPVTLGLLAYCCGNICDDEEDEDEVVEEGEHEEVKEDEDEVEEAEG